MPGTRNGLCRIWAALALLAMIVGPGAMSATAADNLASPVSTSESASDVSAAAVPVSSLVVSNIQSSINNYSVVNVGDTFTIWFDLTNNDPTNSSDPVNLTVTSSYGSIYDSIGAISPQGIVIGPGETASFTLSFTFGIGHWEALANQLSSYIILRIVELPQVNVGYYFPGSVPAASLPFSGSGFLPAGAVAGDTIDLTYTLTNQLSGTSIGSSGQGQFATISLDDVENMASGAIPPSGSYQATFIYTLTGDDIAACENGAETFSGPTGTFSAPFPSLYTQPSTGSAAATITCESRVTPTAVPTETVPPTATTTVSVSVIMVTSDGSDVPDDAVVCVGSMCQSAVSGVSAAVASGSSVLFSDLTPGTYPVTVTDAAPYADGSASVDAIEGTTAVTVLLQLAEPTGTVVQTETSVPTASVAPTQDATPIVTVAPQPTKPGTSVKALPNTGAGSGTDSFGMVSVLLFATTTLLIAGIAYIRRQRA